MRNKENHTAACACNVIGFICRDEESCDLSPTAQRLGNREDLQSLQAAVTFYTFLVMSTELLLQQQVGSFGTDGDIVYVYMCSSLSGNAKCYDH